MLGLWSAGQKYLHSAKKSMHKVMQCIHSIVAALTLRTSRKSSLVHYLEPDDSENNVPVAFPQYSLIKG